MNRGDIFRVRHPSGNPKRFRSFVVLSRQGLIDSSFSTVICAPIYSNHDSLSTQILVGTSQGLKHDSSIHCDELVSLPKSILTNYIGKLNESQLIKASEALQMALDLPL